MGIQKRMRISLLAMMAVFLCCIIVISLVSFAEETEFADLNTSREAEIVFLLDTSESMRTQDRAMSAVDAIRQGLIVCRQITRWELFLMVRKFRRLCL